MPRGTRSPAENHLEVVITRSLCVRLRRRKRWGPFRVFYPFRGP